jgi:hypothetical protein
METIIFWLAMLLGFVVFLLSRKTKCGACKTGHLKLTHVVDPLSTKESLSPLRGMLLPESKETRLKFYYSCNNCDKKWIKVGSKLLKDY